MNWQPIETAPKDGSEILASLLYPIDQSDKKYPGVRETFFAYWVTDFEEYPEGVWAFDCDTPIKHGTPTHWMETPQYVDPETEP